KSAPRKNVPEVVQIKILQPPPPPPPPPPPKPKVEQPKVKPQEFKTPQPPKEAPPAAPALDAKGSGPGDSFGLAGHEGGGDYLGGNGGGGNGLGWYATIVQQRAQDAVDHQPQLKESRFTVKLQIWLTQDGRIQRVNLLHSTGRPNLDQLL